MLHVPGEIYLIVKKFSPFHSLIGHRMAITALHHHHHHSFIAQFYVILMRKAQCLKTIQKGCFVVGKYPTHRKTPMPDLLLLLHLEANNNGRRSLVACNGCRRRISYCTPLLFYCLPLVAVGCCWMAVVVMVTCTIQRSQQFLLCSPPQQQTDTECTETEL